MILFVVLETVKMPLCFLNTLISAILTLSSQWKQQKGQLPFYKLKISR